jgi:hypothetical protein
MYSKASINLPPDLKADRAEMNKNKVGEIRERAMSDCADRDHFGIDAIELGPWTRVRSA